MRGLLPLALLAITSPLFADPPPDVAARVAVALAIAQRQAPVTPQAPAADVAPHSPTPPCPNCQCGCTVTGSCVCKDCDHPLLTKPVGGIPPGPYYPDPNNPGGWIRDKTTTKTPVPETTVLVISKSACPPCEKLRAELQANGDNLPWDIYKNSPRMEAKYGGVTAYPTILLLRDGKEIARHIGYMSAADIQRWRDNPDAPQSRGESVPAAVYSVVMPTYRPMRWASPAACST